MFNILGYFHYKCYVGTGCLYFVKFGKMYNAILDLPFKNWPKVPNWHLLDSLLDSPATMKADACILHVKPW